VADPRRCEPKKCVELQPRLRPNLYTRVSWVYSNPEPNQAQPSGNLPLALTLNATKANPLRARPETISVNPTEPNLFEFNPSLN